MSGWSGVFLGVIAVATLCMALVQIGLIVTAIRVARRVGRLADQFENDVRPLLVNLNAMGRDASRAVALAALQAERADKLMADLMAKVDLVFGALQSALMGPAARGRALVAGIRAAISVIRQARPGGRRGEDEDALFI